MKRLNASTLGLMAVLCMGFTTTSSTDVVQAPASTVSSLPACTSATQGAIFLVTDALLPSALSAVTGGGSVKVPVVCTGTSYIVG